MRKAATMGLAVLVLAMVIAPIPAAAIPMPVGVADMSVSITDGATTAVPGTTVSYTVTVTNNGPDPTPTVLLQLSPNAAGTYSTCTQVSGPAALITQDANSPYATFASFPAGATAVFTVPFNVYSYVSGSVRMEAVCLCVEDTETSNNMGVDYSNLVPTCDLSITKTDGSTTYSPGGSITYTVTVANPGPSLAWAFSVADTLPASLTGAAWTAAFSADPSGATSGTGSIAETLYLEAGSSVTYTITANVAPSATGNLINTATVSVASDTIDPDLTNNTATDVDTSDAPQPPPPVVSWLSVYRLYNVVRGTHFYTASLTERDSVLRTWPGVFVAEGLAWSLNEGNNADPLYRFYNTRTGGHFYTASPQERAAVLANWPGVFVEEGAAFPVCRLPAEGAAPVFRFYNTRSGAHFYTASAAERDYVIAHWPGVFSNEGVAFWLGQ